MASSVKIDRKAVRGKIDEYLKTPPGRQKVIAGATPKGVSETGKLGSNLKLYILREVQASSGGIGSASSGFLGPTAVEAVSDINVSNPRFEAGGYSGVRGASGRFVGSNLETLTFSVDLDFAGSKHRPSVDTAKYGGVTDIVRTLERGYDAKRSVRGPWHGEDILTLAHRPGAFFIAHSAALFTHAYAGKYHPFKISSQYLE